MVISEISKLFAVLAAAYNRFEVDDISFSSGMKFLRTYLFHGTSTG